MTNNFNTLTRELTVAIGEAYEELITMYDPEDVITTAEDLSAVMSRYIADLLHELEYPTADANRYGGAELEEDYDW